LWGISVDSAQETRGFIEKIAADGKGGIPFPMLSDPGHRTIDAYGLQDPRYLKQSREGIPSPTTIVVDRSGRIAWMFIGKHQTERPPLADVRAALAALK
jgi:peroxiredoxin